MIYMPVPALLIVLIFPAFVRDVRGSRVAVKAQHQVVAEYSNIELDAHICKAALRRALEIQKTTDFVPTIYPITPGILQSIIRSLRDGCNSFDVGEASRSTTSEFEMTRDKRWVVKVVSGYEIDSLERIIDKQYMYKHRIMWAYTGLVPIYFSVPQVSAVVMPNFVKEAEDAMKFVLSTNTARFFKYDVKPHQVEHSAERMPFLVKLADLEWTPQNDNTLVCQLCALNDDCPSQDCWHTLQTGLENDFIFLGKKGRTYEFVDYSLIFMLGIPSASDFLGKSKAPAYESIPASCVYSQGKGVMLCVRVVDYLIEKTFFRWIESMFKGYKFSAYDKAMTGLLNCVGDLTQDDCKPYLEMACEKSWSTWCALVGKLSNLWHRFRLHNPFQPYIFPYVGQNNTNIWPFFSNLVNNHTTTFPPG